MPRPLFVSCTRPSHLSRSRMPSGTSSRSDQRSYKRKPVRQVSRVHPGLRVEPSLASPVHARGWRRSGQDGRSGADHGPACFDGPLAFCPRHRCGSGGGAARIRGNQSEWPSLAQRSTLPDPRSPQYAAKDISPTLPKADGPDRTRCPGACRSDGPWRPSARTTMASCAWRHSMRMQDAKHALNSFRVIAMDTILVVNSRFPASSSDRFVGGEGSIPARRSRVNGWALAIRRATARWNANGRSAGRPRLSDRSGLQTFGPRWGIRSEWLRRRSFAIALMASVHSCRSWGGPE